MESHVLTRERLYSLFGPGALRCVFQPVYDVTVSPPEVRAWEGLARGPSGTNLEVPDVLFEYVRRKRAEELVDRLCVTRCLSEFGELPGDARLSLNVHASTLALDVAFSGFLERAARHFGVAADRLTLEVVEHAPAWDGAAFTGRLEELRSLGVSIALDDVGLGYANFRMFLESRPAWVKVDRYLVGGLDRDRRRRAILASLQSLATACGARIVAEGVETEAELAAVKDLGIGLVQGFFFGRPRRAGEWAAGWPAHTDPVAFREDSSHGESARCG